jgi:Spy/CpxP family protein refolding chaperone
MELVDRDVESHAGAPYRPARRTPRPQAAVSKEALRRLFGSPGTLDRMTRAKQTTVLALAGAVALASGAYALGTQVDDGSASASNDRAAGYGHGFGPGRHGGPGLRPGLDSLADHLGVDEADLREALEDIASEHRDDLAQRLADALNVDRAKVEQALEDLRPDRPRRPRPPEALAGALAKELGISSAKVRAALRERRRHPGDLADALGVSEERLREACHAVIGDKVRPRFGNLADELGVTQAQLDAAFEKLRDEQRDDFAQRLADRLNLDVAKVKEALETPRLWGRRGP